jgi:hypothetical protein
MLSMTLMTWVMMMTTMPTAVVRRAPAMASV